MASRAPQTQTQTRRLSKKAKEAERHIVVRLLHDVPRYGRAGSYVPLNPSLMRNRWFPARVADYVPAVQLQQLRAQDVAVARDLAFGLRLPLEEPDAPDAEAPPPARHVRPVEVDVLSPERSMELISAFVPPTIDFYRQRIARDDGDASPRPGASGAADVLTAAAMASRHKSPAHAIYGSVSAADIVQTIRGALAHNDEAARVILTEADVRFVSGHDESDTSRVKQLGVFKIAIQLAGAGEPISRNVRVREKASEA
ncbi:hypothetical protein ACEQ8H_001366 [Pleosporales sp. CAS-2024a]